MRSCIPLSPIYRLVMGLAILMMLITAGRLIWDATHRDGHPASAAPATVSAPPEVTPAPPSTPTAEPSAPYAQTAQARRQWTPTAEGFARGFVAPDTKSRHWLQTLKPYVTPAVARQLRTVDPDTVPAGHYRGMTALEYGDDEVVVRVDYRQGWSLALYLTFDGARWRIRAYDRWEE